MGKFKPEYNEGDICTIKGNLSGWDHNLPTGMEVELKRWDDSDNSWYVASTDGEYENWVGQKDLEDNFEPVTDEEVAELFGLAKPKRGRKK